MATVYKIEIETVSPFISYNEKSLAEMVKSFFDKANTKFENTEVKVTKIA
jgi:hypothetical protein